MVTHIVPEVFAHVTRSQRPEELQLDGHLVRQRVMSPGGNAASADASTLTPLSGRVNPAQPTRDEDRSLKHSFKDGRFYTHWIRTPGSVRSIDVGTPHGGRRQCDDLGGFLDRPRSHDEWQRLPVGLAYKTIYPVRTQETFDCTKGPIGNVTRVAPKLGVFLASERRQGCDQVGQSAEYQLVFPRHIPDARQTCGRAARNNVFCDPPRASRGAIPCVVAPRIAPASSCSAQSTADRR